MSHPRPPLRILISGVAGRMGKALVSLARCQTDIALIAAIERTGHTLIGHDAGQVADTCILHVPITDDPVPHLPHLDAIIDFSTPDSCIQLLSLATPHRVPCVIGTTGFSSSQQETIISASHHAPIVQSGNMSPLVTLLSHLVARTASILGPEFDIDILDIHHRHKVDSPSGSALMLGRAAAKGRGIPPPTSHSKPDHSGPRASGQIGFASLRTGGIIGKHHVIFAGQYESLSFVHEAQSRFVFADGAFKAAHWVKNRPPGLYHMDDVLGLKQEDSLPIPGAPVPSS